MKKKINLIFFIFFLIYIALNMFFSTETFILFIFNIFVLVIDIIFLIVNKVKFDKVDIFMFLVPLAYLLTVVFGLNVNSAILNLEFVFNEVILVLTLISFKKISTPQNKNIFLIFLEYVGILTFILTIAAYDYQKIKMIGIASYFGDTYPSSVFRMYGTLNYCNASAVIFLVIFFISLFNLYKNDNAIHKLSLFTCIIGMIFTLSKMITIDFFIVIIFLIIYYLRYKQWERLKFLFNELLSLIFPVVSSLYIFRNYIINYNFPVFFTKFILLFFLYLIIRKFVYFIGNKKFVVLIPFSLVVCSSYIYFYYNPKVIPLTINNYSLSNEYVSNYLLDLNLSEGKHTIKLDIENNGKTTPRFLVECASLINHSIDFNVVGVYDGVEFEVDIPHNEDAVYYELSVSGLTKESNYKIKHIYIDGIEKNINTFLVPYQITSSITSNDMGEISDSSKDKWSVVSRLAYYEDAVNYISKNYFIFGKGYHTFEYYRNNFKNVHKYLETKCHSILFELWLDIGVVGVICLIFMYFYGIKMILLNINKVYLLPWFIMFCSICIFSPFDLLFYVIGVRQLALLSFLLFSKYN